MRLEVLSQTSLSRFIRQNGFCPSCVSAVDSPSSVLGAVATKLLGMLFVFYLVFSKEVSRFFSSNVGLGADYKGSIPLALIHSPLGIHQVYSPLELHSSILEEHRK